MNRKEVDVRLLEVREVLNELPGVSAVCVQALVGEADQFPRVRDRVVVRCDALPTAVSMKRKSDAFSAVIKADQSVRDDDRRPRRYAADLDA